MKICIANTRSFTFKTLCKGLVPYLESRGHEVHLVVGDDEYIEELDTQTYGHPTIHVIPMARLPSPIKDLGATAKMTRLFANEKFDVIHISTPKASLVGSAAGFLTRTPSVFVYRRRVYELMTGWKKRLYILTDMMTAAMSFSVIPISNELESQLVADRVCGLSKIRRTGDGSSNGIDTAKFCVTPEVQEAAESVRARLQIRRDAKVLLYLGRIAREKGIDDLPEIFNAVRLTHPHIQLVVVGPQDDRDPISAAASNFLYNTVGVHVEPYTEDPRPYYALADLFVFPSFFEGYGNVLLEAAAMEVPSVAYDVSGVREAVVNNTTGRLVGFRDVDAAAAAVVALLGDQELYAIYSRAARERVVDNFDQKVVWASLERHLIEAAQSVRSSPRTLSQQEARR